MKQTLTLKVLVVSAVALSVATGCERRTRPPAKPDVTTQGGDAGNNNVGNKNQPTPTPTPESQNAPTGGAEPTKAPEDTRTDDQKAADLNKDFDAYLKGLAESAEKGDGFIKLVDEKGAAEELIVKLDTAKIDTVYKSILAKIEAGDAETLKTFKRADGQPFTADDLIVAMKDALEGSAPETLKSKMTSFIDGQSKLQPKEQPIVDASKANVTRAEATVKAIEPAVKHIDGLK